MMPDFRLGRRRPPEGKRKIHLHDYRTTAALPAPPPSCDYAAKATRALDQIYLNDELGDCVIACMAHAEGVFTGNAGQTPTYFTNEQIIAEYSAIGGYVPGNPDTDQGCDERTALAYWQRTGFPAGANKITGWVSIDGSDPIKVKTALWLFENLIFGVELPDQWISPFPSRSGFVWEVEGDPDPSNGHCFLGVGYGAYSVTIDSWGMIGHVTYGAIRKYATTPGSGELYAVLSPQVIASAQAKAPNGFDWAQLEADLKCF